MARNKLTRTPTSLDKGNFISSETGAELTHPNQEWGEEVRRTGIRNPKLRKLLTNDTTLDAEAIKPYDPEDHVPKIADPAVYKTIIDLIEEGNYITTVANYAGIAPATLYTYLERGKNGYDTLYHQFYLDVQKAWASAEVNTLRKLREHENADWRVSAWRLERTYPERYALKTITRTEVNISGEVQHKIKNDFADSLLDDPEKREMARKLLSS
jgi:hypothetical protein